MLGLCIKGMEGRAVKAAKTEFPADSEQPNGSESQLNYAREKEEAREFRNWYITGTEIKQRRHVPAVLDSRGQSNSHARLPSTYIHPLLRDRQQRTT